MMNIKTAPRLLTFLLGWMVASTAAQDILVNNTSANTTITTTAPLAIPSSTNTDSNNNDNNNNVDCPLSRIHKLPEGHQRIYRVGVLAIRGAEAAWNEFNTTFGEYLTATAGQRFDPPLQFEMKPLNFLSLFTDTEASLVDLIYVNPSAFSCIESEYTARSLVSQTSRRKISGNVYDLKKFGGVIMARADNDEVQDIQDLRGKVVAAASISGLGSGQMQFLEMQKAGMSYINGKCVRVRSTSCVYLMMCVILTTHLSHHSQQQPHHRRSKATRLYVQSRKSSQWRLKGRL